MAIYLVQHGRAVIGGTDPDPGLSEGGRADSLQVAALARDYRVTVAGVVHSGRKRAKETALIFAETLGPGITVSEVSGMGPKDDVAAFAAGLDLSANLMYVGHLPFMERLASLLVVGDAGRPLFRFQNSGILCIDLHPDAKTPVLTWALMPRIP